MDSVKRQSSGSGAVMEHVPATHRRFISGAELVWYGDPCDLCLSVGLEDKVFN